MHYELYLDSLFFLNFGMNLILLILVDHSTCRTATWYRLLFGAGIGAVCYLLPFLWKGTAGFKVLICFLSGTLLMLYVSFPVRNLKMLWHYFQKLMLDTFLLGGALAAVVRGIPAIAEYFAAVVPILGLGSLGAMWILRSRQREMRDTVHCVVRLQGTGEELRVRAIVDSGNTLTEPISRSPVSVIDAKVFYRLWPEGLPGMRVIPYHSVGKKSGILYGYPVQRILIEKQGTEKECEHVWLAVSGEDIAGGEFSVLLHPALLQKTGESVRGRYKGKVWMNKGGVKQSGR